MTRQVQNPCAMLSQAFWTAIGSLTALRLLAYLVAKHHKVSRYPVLMLGMSEVKFHCAGSLYTTLDADSLWYQ